MFVATFIVLLLASVSHQLKIDKVRFIRAEWAELRVVLKFLVKIVKSFA